MKIQTLFSSKDKSKKLKCRLLQFLFGALRINLKYMLQIEIDMFKLLACLITMYYPGDRNTLICRRKFCCLLFSRKAGDKKICSIS